MLTKHEAIDCGVYKSKMLMTKHTKFIENKVGYEWIFRKPIATCIVNSGRMMTESPLRRISKIRIGQCRGEKQVLPRKRGRLQRVIRNPCGRKGKPKGRNSNADDRTEEEEDVTESSDIKANFVEVVEQQDISEALSSPQAQQWKSAINEELERLEKRKTWKVTTLPERRKSVGCRWVFKI